MKTKYNILRLIPIFVVILLLFIFIIKNKLNDGKLIESKINDIVVERSNWQLRTTEFYLRNGLRIDSTYLNNYDIQIGDSISKKKSSSIFIVYRKDKSIFKYYREYDFRE